MAQDHGPLPTLREVDAAEYIGYRPSALRLWRRQGRGPKFVKFGRSIRYRVADLDAWLAEHLVTPTREPQSA